MKTRTLSLRSRAMVMTAFLLLLAFPAAVVFAATTGPSYPGTATSVDGTGEAWTIPGGSLSADDGSGASVTFTDAADGAEDLHATNFGFSLPTDATIQGITVEINRWASATKVIRDEDIQLLGGSAAGENKASVDDWGTNQSDLASYGGVSDTWGLTWTPAQVNSSDFGVLLDVDKDGVDVRTATVDFIRITITYTRPTPTVSVTNSPVTYNGGPQAAVVTGSVPGMVSDVKYDGSSTVPTDAGTYVITADFDATDADYTDLDDAPAGSFVIEPADATIDITPYNVVYDGQPHSATGTATGLNSLDLSAGLDLSATTHTAAGTYASDAWTFISPDANYNDDSGTVSNTITPAGLTITGIVADNKAYDGTTTATLSGTAALNGVIGDDDVQLDASGVTANFNDPAIGTDKPVTVTGFALTGADAGNYSLAQPTGLTADIAGAAVTVTGITASNKVYDGTTGASLDTSGATLVGVAGGDDVQLDTSGASGAFSDKNVGSGKTVLISGLALTGADAANYTIVQPTATANITQAVLTVTANNQSKTAGQPDPAFTFTYSGFVSGETSAVLNTQPACTVSVPHAAVGTYPIVCSGGADDNYSFTYVNGTLTVNPVMTQTFDDVPESYWAWSFVERLYNAGITGGCATNPLRYCPDNTVTRAEMAVFLLRGIHGASYSPPAVGASTGFADVPTSYWAAAWIKQLAAEGITTGCGNGNYCPDAPVTRAEMAVFLLRSKHGTSYNPPAVGASTGFSDVPTSYWAAAWIKQLVVEGITSGCGANTYCPENPVTRAEMAVFLVRTFSLP